GILLKNSFATVYGSAGVGIGGSGGAANNRRIKFDAATNIEAFLPAGGKPAVLTLDDNDPLFTAAGVFAGQVLTLRISVDVSNKGVTQPGLRLLKIAAG